MTRKNKSKGTGEQEGESSTQDHSTTSDEEDRQYARSTKKHDSRSHRIRTHSKDINKIQ